MWIKIYINKSENVVVQITAKTKTITYFWVPNKFSLTISSAHGAGRLTHTHTKHVVSLNRIQKNMYVIITIIS